MKRMGDFVCKHNKLIILIALILLIPSLIGMYKTKINYDILVYLPDDIETIKGEKILTDDFHMGAYAVAIIENMSDNDIISLEHKFKTIDGVNKVISVNDILGTNIPIESLPDEIIDKVAKKNSKLIFVTFNDSTSADKTLDAVSSMRKMVNKSSKIGGMSTMVLDTKELFNNEMTLYVIIAVILCIIVLMISLDSYLVPFLLILNIGLAILYNMGTNIFLGNISYITKAISSVLQLGVTTDFSIFLYHKYENAKKEEKDNKKAMSIAIHDTLISVLGSSLTTVAGFLALCTMTLKLGTDIGLVMAKGVIFGLVCVITVFPALLLIFNNKIEKTHHRVVLPKFTFVKHFVMKHYILIFIAFLLLLIPAYKSQSKTPVYYKLDESIPESYGYSKATKTLKEDYSIVSQEIILVSRELSLSDTNKMIEEIENIEGIDLVLSGSSLAKYGINESILSDDLKSIYQTDKYKMILINSRYDIATDELNDQITKINKIVKSYDKKAIVAGEGPLMKDLIETTDTDFKNVNYTSIVIIFVLMLLVLRSISLPVLLVAAIEFAIFINMGIPYFHGTEIPFISSVVIGTIQLGATIDYAILMTTKYLEERKKGRSRKQSVSEALDNSVSSIFVSGMCFFAATIGVAVVSQIDLIGSLCTLISRGAIISMIIVMFVVPSLLLTFDRIITHTTLGFKKGKIGMKKLSLIIFTILLCLTIMPVSALTKNETVYVNYSSNGKIKNINVSEHLSNINKKDKIVDLTDLKKIENTSGNEKFEIDGEKIVFENKGNDIYYKGESEKQLPVNLKITYKLNGKKTKLSKMLGKKGKIEIALEYQNNDKHNVVIDGKETEIYTPFVAAMTTILDGKKVSNVNVNNGKVISNGQNYIIAGLATPGLYESLDIDELSSMNKIIITYDTTNFELTTMYSALTAKVVDSVDLSILDNMDYIYSNVNILSMGSKKLVNATKQLNEGVSKIDQGVSKAISGLKNNQDKIDEKTLDMIKQSASKNATETIEKNKNNIMSSAINEVEKEENETNQIRIASDYGVDNNASLIDALKLETHKQMQLTEEQVTAIYDGCNNGIVDYCNQVQTIEAYEQSAIAQAKDNFYNNALALAKQVAANTAYKTSLQVASETASKTSELVAISVSDQVKTNIISKVVTSLDELENGLNTLNNGTKKLEQGMEEFNNKGINTIYDLVYSKVKPNVSKLKELKTLAHNYKTYTKVDDHISATTKFIYKVSGKKAKEEIKAKPSTEKKQSIFSRVKNLFK